MNRRAFLATLSAGVTARFSTTIAALALPPRVAAGQTAVKAPRIGVLGLFSPELGARSVAAVREGLGELGWREGQNIHFEYRYASGMRDRLAPLAAELVQQKVDVIGA